ncbi:MAG: hypothetical protein AAB317_04410 [Nitrospirota bacterium]
MINQRFYSCFLFCLIALISIVVTEKVAWAEDAATPAVETGGDLKLVLKEKYKMGDKVEVKMKNTGKISYLYNQKSPACDFSYFDGAEGEFFIPQAKGCDLVITTEIAPGETKKLFEWDLSQCLQDDFECFKNESLPEGQYTIKGSFIAQTTDTAAEYPDAQIAATFHVVQ